MREEALLGKVGGERSIRRGQLIRFGEVIVAGGNRTILGFILLPALLLGEGSSSNEKLQSQKSEAKGRMYLMRNTGIDNIISG